MVTVFDEIIRTGTNSPVSLLSKMQRTQLYFMMIEALAMRIVEQHIPFTMYSLLRLAPTEVRAAVDSAYPGIIDAKKLMLVANTVEVDRG